MCKATAERTRLILLIIGVSLYACDTSSAQSTPALLSEIFQDHMVIQRDVPIRVWGQASPGSIIVAELEGDSAEVVVDASGEWSASLPPRGYGGPYSLTVQSSRKSADGSPLTQLVDDILIGDVFLCTGQSNMVLTVREAADNQRELRSANDDRIRMVTIPNRSTPMPQHEFLDPLEWQAASPETVGRWSAVCYFFARDLRRGPLASDNVPVGLITSAWGGSSIRAWMNEDALRSVGGFNEALDALRLYAGDPDAAQKSFGRLWEDWWAARHPGMSSAPWLPDTGEIWPSAPAGLGDWTKWDDLVGFTGMVWFRTTVDLTTEQAASGASLAIGGIDEVDETWMNGHVVGNTFGYGSPRTYAIPASMLKPGANVIVVNVLNTYAAGGMVGDPTLRVLHLGNGTSIPLTDWQYSPVREAIDYPPRAPWESVGGLSTIHNAMVEPLRNLGLRGVLWYQGESDTDGKYDYEALLRALIIQWRTQFDTPPPSLTNATRLPAFIVQLPNFGTPPAAPEESGWADVREKQWMATSDDPNAATIVTIDVGEARNLHPPNKQDVGLRLARAARQIVYGEDVTATGPVAVTAQQSENLVRLIFRNVTGSLVVYSGVGPIGFELCGTDKGSCRYADARIDGSDVTLLVEDEAPVTRVRYAWASSPIVNLFDESGLPVGPFEIAVTASD